VVKTSSASEPNSTVSQLSICRKFLKTTARKPYQGFESLSLRQQVLTAEKVPAFLSRNTRNMPVFCNLRPPRGLERADCPGPNGVNLPAFLWRGHSQSGFSDSVAG
jgi:hypothetical protein